MSPHSADLRLGIATTLALLGTYGATSDQGLSISLARAVVRDVLRQANEASDIHLWASLADVLSLLAEAAPDEFLEGVREGLQGDLPILAGIFMDKSGASPFFSDATHSYLLWALELLAWSPTHLGQVADVLARLAEVDPGGTYSNRPNSALAEIFSPWHPQNSVGPDRRFAAIDGLRDRHSGVAWKLLLSMLPDRHAIATPNQAPRFRDWKPLEITVTWPEYWQIVDQVAARLIADVGSDAERWKELIDELPNLSDEPRKQVLDKLRDLGPDNLDTERRFAIWDQLHRLAARHRAFADTEWSMPEEAVSAVEEVAAEFEPLDPIASARWLFDEHLPDLVTKAPRDDFRAYEDEIRDARRRAAERIFAETRWEEIRGRVSSFKVPWFFGVATADAGVDLEPEVTELLMASDVAEEQFAAAYLSTRFGQKGWEWIEELIGTNDNPILSARILLTTHDYPRAWDTAESLGDETNAEFWRLFRVVGLGAEFSHVELVAERLLAAGRPRAALDLFALYLRQGQNERRTELIAEGLELLLETQETEPGSFERLSQWEIQQLFAALSESELDEGRLARLEWAYLPAFDYNTSPPTLGKRLASEPDFFVEVVCAIYRPRPRDDEGEDADEQSSPEAARRREIAKNAHRLLMEWRTVPGTHDGTIDASELNAWVDRARDRLREERRAEVGDEQIGQILAFARADDEGARPPRAVRDLLERVQSSHIENGLETQMFNSRGVVSRDPWAGGRAERELAQRYTAEAEQFEDRWPRTAAILRGLAGSYERWAAREDAEDERRWRGLAD